jgi:hypothetical protein
MPTVDIVYLNAGPPSEVTPEETNADILAILTRWKPDILMGCEAIGDGPLPSLSRPRFGKVRDQSDIKHSNLYGYFDEPFRAKWQDMNIPIPRRPGRHGVLPARAFYRGDYRGAQIIDAHHPPGWRGTGPARLEHRNALMMSYAPWLRDDWLKKWDTAEKRDKAKARPRLLGWDCNMTPRVVRAMADKMDARVVGDRIDCLIIRNMEVVGEPVYTRNINGYQLHTDHPWGCLRVKLKW